MWRQLQLSFTLSQLHALGEWARLDPISANVHLTHWSCQIWTRRSNAAAQHFIASSCIGYLICYIVVMAICYTNTWNVSSSSQRNPLMVYWWFWKQNGPLRISNRTTSLAHRCRPSSQNLPNAHFCVQRGRCQVLLLEGTSWGACITLSAIRMSVICFLCRQLKNVKANGEIIGVNVVRILWFPLQPSKQAEWDCWL